MTTEERTHYDSDRIPEFDQFAANYDESLNKGLSVSGEDKNYFIEERVRFLVTCLDRRAFPRGGLRVMDFGCGTGSAIPALGQYLQPGEIIGMDISEAELAIARRDHPAVKFLTPASYVPTASLDVIYCNGTFHHILPPQRAAVVDFIFRCLRPGGIFALWENNPWNPGTRYVMSRIPFDKDAITLTPPEARRLLQAGGLTRLHTDFLFYFPKILGFLRFLEPAFRKLPLGAQYQVLTVKSV